MTHVLVFLAFLLWTAILTYHELRMKTAPHSGNEEDLREEFLKFLRETMLPAFVSAHNFALFFAEIEAKQKSTIDEKSDITNSIIMRCSPSIKPLLEVTNGQAASLFSLVELERIFVFALHSYDVAAANLQKKSATFSPADPESARAYELKKSYYVAANKKMKSKIDELHQRNKFKIIKKGISFDSSVYSEYMLMAKYQKAASIGS